MCKMPIKKTESSQDEVQCPDCQHVYAQERKPERESHVHTFDIDSKYLTIEFERICEAKYITNFMTQLKSQLCCDSASFPYMIIQFGNGESTRVSKKGKSVMSLTDAEEQLNMCKEIYKTPITSRKGSKKSGSKISKKLSLLIILYYTSYNEMYKTLKY